MHIPLAGSLHKYTGRCLCLLNSFLLPSSFCNNNNNNKKTNKEEKLNPLKLSTSKKREGCRRSDAIRPLEAGGSMLPVPSGTCKDTWAFAALQSWEDCGNVAFSSRNRVPQGDKERVAHPWFLVCQSHFYILFGYWFSIFIPYIVHLVQEKMDSPSKCALLAGLWWKIMSVFHLKDASD